VALKYAEGKKDYLEHISDDSLRSQGRKKSGVIKEI